MQVIHLIIFAIAAAVVLYQLYAVLGRRVGRQPEDLTPAPEAARTEGVDPALPRDPAESSALTGLAALKARDPSFDVGRFLAGAKGAYELIVRAFAAGDRSELKERVSPKVFKGFDKAIEAREARGDTEEVEFLHAPRADLEEVTVDGDVARVRVRFLAEHRARVRNNEGEAVDDRRTAEAWTFERSLASVDPNWTLVRVDAAED